MRAGPQLVICSEEMHRNIQIPLGGYSTSVQYKWGPRNIVVLILSLKYMLQKRSNLSSNQKITTIIHKFSSVSARVSVHVHARVFLIHVLLVQFLSFVVKLVPFALLYPLLDAHCLSTTTHCALIRWRRMPLPDVAISGDSCLLLINALVGHKNIKQKRIRTKVEGRDGRHGGCHKLWHAYSIYLL